ncbi:MAG: hypothetical protein JWP75_539 [Frondihabitans sp.]|jgi:uncharacterized membrane protein HdeD (DUF308 family)|nr:hypothetical protein [Frondihabitans sp.]
MQPEAASDARYWPVPILRAIPFLVLGMIITFVNNHSTSIGLVVFGATTVVGGLVLVFGSRRWLDDSGSRSLAVVQGIVSLVFGVLALVLSHGGVPGLVALVVGWAVLSGALEVVTGLRRRRRSALARDWIVLGVITLALVVAYFLVPSDYAEPFGGIEKIKGTLTAATILVGILGAYGAVAGVFLVIQGLSLKWQTGTPESFLAEVAESSGGGQGTAARGTAVQGTAESNIDGAHRP